MSTTYELMERIQKYDGVEKFLVVNKNGNKLSTDIKEEEKGKIIPNNFNSNYQDIPKLVEKAVSCVRDIDPMNDLSFIQISYSNYDYLIAKDEGLYVFTAIRTNQRDKQ